VGYRANSRPYRRPKRFDIDAHIAAGSLQFGNGKTLRLKASIDDGLAYFLRETPISEDMRIDERGKDYLLTATVADSWQLRWWILSWAASLVVNKPHTLRKDVKETSRALSIAYTEKVEKERHEYTWKTKWVR
jgi:hypothetical protein